MNPYIDTNYVDRTAEIEAAFQPTLEDIKRDPAFYAELVNDLMFHWIHGTKETPLMIVAKRGHLQRVAPPDLAEELRDLANMDLSINPIVRARLLEIAKKIKQL